jgi:hypothetical protein
MLHNLSFSILEMVVTISEQVIPESVAIPSRTSRGKRQRWYEGNALSVFSGTAQFKSLPRCQISWLRFSVVFLDPSSQMPGQYVV